MAGTITFNTLIDELATAVGLNWTAAVGTVDVTNIQSYQFISHLNRALRWIWKADDPYFAWPASVTSSANITITSGVITWAAVSNSDWVSFWESDPSRFPGTSTPPFSTVLPVPVTWDGVQFRTQSSSVTSPCFAYWRSAAPQGTWVTSGSSPTYATPTIPEEFRDAVVNYALAQHLRKCESYEAASEAMAAAIQWKEGRVCAMKDADTMTMPWKDNVNVIV